MPNTLEDSYLKFQFCNIHPNKLSFSFTWDDNFESHIKYIAPVFDRHQTRCTFYINPGELGFDTSLQEGYSSLASQGFEIGSHGYTHHHFSNLTKHEFLQQLLQSKEAISQLTGSAPITFAFPHHDFTTEMIAIAKKIYFETRNTLVNTPRFSLKSYTRLSDIQKTVNNAISVRQSIVFSGHSIRLEPEDNIANGYEPISLELLNDAISFILKYQDIAEICTFSQASLKEYICAHCKHTQECFYISNNQLTYLNTFGLTPERIGELI